MALWGYIWCFKEVAWWNLNNHARDLYGGLRRVDGDDVAWACFVAFVSSPIWVFILPIAFAHNRGGFEGLALLLAPRSVKKDLKLRRAQERIKQLERELEV
jgi:hypothetical protein